MRGDRLPGKFVNKTAWLAVSGLVLAVLSLGANCSGGGNGNTNDNDDIEPVFPADYESTFTVVRDCRPTIEHAAVTIDGVIVDYIRVLANDVAAQAYLNNENPLPVGSVIIKEGFSGTDCGQDSTLRNITAMLKEQPGFDADDGDWHWQTVAPDRRVTDDTKTTCISCHRRPECLARDYVCTVP